VARRVPFRQNLNPKYPALSSSPKVKSMKILTRSSSSKFEPFKATTKTKFVLKAMFGVSFII